MKEKERESGSSSGKAISKIESGTRLIPLWQGHLLTAELHLVSICA
jgi:hypothetical protein